jgi:hypothetical protein
LGMWFACNDNGNKPEVLTKYGKKADQAQIKLYKNGQPVGEVKIERTYQVIPPSYKFIDPATGDDVKPGQGGERVDYKMISDLPPAAMSLEWLISELQRIGITFSSKLEAECCKAGRHGLRGRYAIAKLWRSRRPQRTQVARLCRLTWSSISLWVI